MARLYIGNLPHQAAEHELQAWIEQHGFKVETVQVIRDLDTGASRGFGFAELPEVIHAKEAVDALKVKGENRQAGGTRSPKKRVS